MAPWVKKPHTTSQITNSGSYSCAWILSISRLTTIESRLTSVESRLTILESRVAGVDLRLTKLEDRVTTLEERVEARFYETKPIWERALAEIAELRDEVRQEFADVREEMRAGFQKIDERFEILEQKLDVLNEDVLTVRAKQRHLESRVSNT